MTDEADLASEITQMNLTLALGKAREKPSQIPFKGFCYNCEDPLQQEQRFCDTECRDDWDRRQARR